MSMQEIQSLSNKSKPSFKRDTLYFESKTDASDINFQDRPLLKSTKNFLLVESKKSQKVLLQFGRAGQNTFNMDVCYPLSLFQAFSICLTTFDKQWWFLQVHNKI